jgi:hypothetical protein
LISRNSRAQIPYAAEQGNKSDEQGDKVNDQEIKSAELGTYGNRVRGGRGGLPATGYCTMKPPSVTSSAPVTNEASSETRNSTP